MRSRSSLTLRVEAWNEQTPGLRLAALACHKDAATAENARKNRSLPQEMLVELLHEGDPFAWQNPSASRIIRARTTDEIILGALVCLHGGAAPDEAVRIARRWWLQEESASQLLRHVIALGALGGADGKPRRRMAHILAMCARTALNMPPASVACLTDIERWVAGHDVDLARVHKRANSSADAAKSASADSVAYATCAIQAYENEGNYITADCVCDLAAESHGNGCDDHRANLARIIRREIPTCPLPEAALEHPYLQLVGVDRMGAR